ncbi:MAG: hypothetical protein KF717_13220 [Cyclobacteriaceae bacterium]|nr:hypothetical protein [Cyclobacteriaceae bacterium]MCB9236365.1 hypothetical protein [Flammeovirgaceae bacterium]
MKNLFKYLLSLALLSPLICFSQGLSIELTGNEGKRIKELADKFASNLLKETKAIRFIYVEADEDGAGYYFGLISDRKKIETYPPSYYFFNSNHEPVAIYTGFERNVSFNQEYLDEIKGLADKYLWPDEVVMTMHYHVWFIRFIDGKEIEFTERLSIKRQQQIPSWIVGIGKSKQ